MGNRLDLEIKLNRPQLRYLQTIAPRRRIFGGFGRGIGKSFLLRRAYYLQIAQMDRRVRWNNGEQIRGVRIITIMPTLKQFKDVHGSDITEELSPAGRWGFLGGKIDKTTWQISFPGGSWIKPFPASAYNARTARGMRADILGADEIDDIDAEVYDSVAIPWLSAPWSLGIEMPFGTPTRGRHGLWYRFLQEGRRADKIRSGEIPEEEALQLPEAQATLEVLKSIDDLEDKTEESLNQRTLDALKGNYAFHATYREAPETVSPIAVARARANTPEATFKREWEADPDAGEGLVYPFISEPDHTGFTHVKEPPPNTVFREIHIGMDHGWVDPGALLRCGVVGHGEDAVLWCLDEHYESECPNHIWDERAAAWGDGTFWPDPSRPDRIDNLRARGLTVRSVDNNILGGVARLADLMFVRETESGERYSRLYVSPRCRNLIRELGLYRRKKLTDGTFDEQPEDKHNHLPDCLRYVAVGRFGRGLNVRHVASGR